MPTVGAYEHVGEKRVNLATDETAIALDKKDLADGTASLEVEKSSYPRLAWSRGRDDDALLAAYGPLYVHEKITPLGYVKSLRVCLISPKRVVYEACEP